MDQRHIPESRVRVPVRVRLCGALLGGRSVLRAVRRVCLAHQGCKISNGRYPDSPGWIPGICFSTGRACSPLLPDDGVGGTHQLRPARAVCPVCTD